jgi:hypothetical protein
MSAPGAATIRNGWANAAIVLGIVAVAYVGVAIYAFNRLVNDDLVGQARVVAWVFVVLPIAAIVLGVIGMRAAQRRNGRGKGTAIAGIVLGIAAIPLAVASSALLLGCAMDSMHCR